MRIARERERENEGFRRTLSAEETGMPGLSAFGHAAGSRSELPVLEHRHPDKLEVVLQLSGMRVLTVEDVNYTIYPGDAFLILPCEEHRGGPVNRESGEIYWFQLDLNGEEEEFLGLCRREAALSRAQLRQVRTRRFSAGETLANRFGEAFELLAGGTGGGRLRGRGLFLYALFSLLEATPELTALTGDIDSAKRYILSHIREPLDMDELLAETGLPLREFRERFERQIGMKPRDYILPQKVESAKKMIAGTRRAVADIAFAYHFNSAAIFRMHFKNITGMSPEKYRKKYGGPEGVRR